MKFRDQFEYELKLADSSIDYQLVEIIAGRMSQRGLEGLSEGLTTLVQFGLDWLARFDKVTSARDLTGYSIPSISPHGQNEDIHEFGNLVFLLRAAFERLLKRRSPDALAIAQRWASLEYPLFKRLSLYAAQRIGSSADSLALKILTERGGEYLWIPDTTREVSVYLRQSVRHWKPTNIAKLCRAILRGPDRERFRTMSDRKWRELRDVSICRRLKKLKQGRVQLSPAAASKLTKIGAKFPYKLPSDHSDEFLIFSGGVHDYDWRKDVGMGAYNKFLESSPSDRIASWDNSQSLILKKLALESPQDALETLEVALESNFRNAEFWSEGISSIGQIIDQSMTSGGETLNAG